MRNNKNLKNILKASTMLAGLAFGAMEAGAVSVNFGTNAGSVDLNDLVGWVQNSDLKANADGGNGAESLVGNVADFVIRSIDINDKQHIRFRADQSGSIGSIKDIVGDGARMMTLTVADGKVVKLTGSAGTDNDILANVYTGLGATTLGGGSTLEITATKATFANATIDGIDDHQGILTITGAENAFSQAIGNDHSLAAINVTGNKTTFSAVVKSDAITVSGADTTFSGNVTLSALGGADAKFTLSGANGEAKFANGTTLKVGGDDERGSILGEGKLTALGGLTIKNFAKIGIDGTAPVFADIVDGKTLTLNANGAADIWSSIGAAADTAKVLFANGAAGDVTLHDNIGKSDMLFDDVTLGQHDKLILSGGVSINSKTITFGDAASGVTLNKSSALNGQLVAGDNFGANAKGVINVVSGSDATTIAGNIVGGANNNLVTVQFGLDDIGNNSPINTSATFLPTSTKATDTGFGVQTIDFTRAVDATTQFVVGMNGLHANSPLTLTVGKSNADNAGITTTAGKTAGALVFENNSNNNKITLATAGGNVTKIGLADAPLALLDAEGSDLTIQSNLAGDQINIGNIKAKNLTLNPTNVGGSSFTIKGAELTATENALTIDAAGKTVKLNAGSNLGKVNGVQLIKNSTLEFDDGVNLTYTGNVVGTTNNEAELVFLGTTTLDGTGTLGSDTKRLSRITLGAANKVVTFGSGDIFVSHVDGIKYASNEITGSMVINGNVHGNITTGNGGTGHVTFAAASVVDGKVGVDGTAFHTVEVGADVTVAQVTAGSTYNTQCTTFTKDATLTLGDKIAGNSSLGTVKTTAGNKTGTIKFNNDFIVNGNIGEDGDNLKSLIMAKNKTLTIGTVDATNIFANVFTSTADQGTVILDSAAAAVTINGDVGSSTAQFLQATLGGANATTVNNVHGKKVSITGAGTVKALSVNSADATDGIKFTAGDGTLTIKDAGSINTFVTTYADGNGKLSFDGAATIGGNLGKAGAALHSIELNGTADKVVSFKGDQIHLGDGSTQRSTLELTKDTTIKSGGDYTINGGAVNVGTNDFLFDGKIVVGANGATFNVDANRPYVAKGAGGAGADFSIDAGNKVTINSTGTATDFPKHHGLRNLFVNAAGDPIAIGDNDRNNVVLTATGAASNDKALFYTTYVDNNLAAAAAADAALRAEITAANNKAPVKGQAYYTVDVTKDKLFDATVANVGAGVSELADAFVDQIDTISGDAAKLLASLNGATVAERTGVLQKVADLSTATNVAGAAVNDAIASVLNASKSRIGDLVSTNIISVLGSNDVAGVAAGDVASSEKFGVWANVMGGQATQKLRKNVAGYQSKTVGATIGADTMLSDKALVGMLVGNTNGNVKHKDAKVGDKTKSSSWLFGVYGSYDIGQTDFFVQGNFTVAQTSVKSKEGRDHFTNGVKKSETASSKYDVLGYGAQVLAGYKHSFSNSYIIPTAGLGYNYFGDVSYTTTGTTAQNTKVTTKSTSVVSALAGVKFGTMVDMDGTTLMPEVHMNGSYALNSPSAKGNFALNGLKNPIEYKGPKAAKFGYNFGTSVMAQSDEIEYGIGYDADISDKYLAHQGSLKFKVKF